MSNMRLLTCCLVVKRLIWVFSLLLASACSSRSGETSNPGDNNANGGGNTNTPGDNGTSATPGPTLRFQGRTDTADANGVRICWPGTQIIAGFTGTALTASLATVTNEWTYGADQLPAENLFDVYIDDRPPEVIRLVSGVTSYQVAVSLNDGNHVVRMSKRTECDMGTVQFYGFTTQSGKSLIAGPSVPTRRIEFIGDSGTAGYGADANVTLENMCGFSPQTERADASYAFQSGLVLNADVHNTSYSGKGLYQNRDVVGDPYNTLPRLWTYTMGDTYVKTTTWDASQWIPQAVVAVVSGNDFSASTPAQGPFVSTVVAFFKQIRTAYPDAHLFLMVSPMLRSAGSDNTPNAGPRATGIQYAQAAVKQLNATDSKVYYLDLAEDFGPTFGCDQHINTANHRKYGIQIAQAIAAKTGWNVDTSITQF